MRGASARVEVCRAWGKGTDGDLEALVGEDEGGVGGRKLGGGHPICRKRAGGSDAGTRERRARGEGRKGVHQRHGPKSAIDPLRPALRQCSCAQRAASFLMRPVLPMSTPASARRVAAKLEHRKLPAARSSTETCTAAARQHDGEGKGRDGRGVVGREDVGLLHTSKFKLEKPQVCWEAETWSARAGGGGAATASALRAQRARPLPLHPPRHRI